MEPPTTASATTSVPVSDVVAKTLVVFVENHSLAEMQAHMPYLNGLGQRYGYATDYTAMRHPSLPNYLAVAGGSTFGITDDEDPSAHRLRGATVFGQALQKGDTAKVYAESEPSNCYRTSSGKYAVRHTAWPYFVDEAAACKAYQPPSGSESSGEFSADAAAGTLPNVGWLIPNVCNDGHDCSLATADNWLSTMLPDVFNGPDWASGELAVVITADEDDWSSHNTVLTVVAHPSLSGEVVNSPLNHYSLSGFLSAMSGSAPLRHATGAPSFAAAFGLTTP
jgi:acid phosphatase